MQNYDFTSLSPYDFEILMRDLLKAEYGTHFETFSRGPDGGVDLRSVVAGSKTIVQCKHYSGSTFSDLKKAAKKEIPKIAKENPDVYIFATTQELSKGQKDELFEILKGSLRSPSDILGRTDVNELLSRHSDVEKNHFKLWLASTAVLERIVQSGIWARSEALMESIQSRVRLYVTNDSYSRASEILSAQRVVAITGPPGVGKSMLAEMLLLTHWENSWQITTINSDIEEGWSAWKKGKSQIFYYDDFLGQTDLSERSSQKNESSSLVKFIDQVAATPGKRLVLTTRSHILGQAQIRNEPLARSGIGSLQCIVEIKDFSYTQRSYVLYNHLYFSNQERRVIRELASDSEAIWTLVRHANFTPRTVEQILRRRHDTGESAARALGKAFDQPIDLWGSSFENFLSETARVILLALITFPVSGASVSMLRKIVGNDPNPISFTQALRVLEGDWVKIQNLNYSSLSNFQKVVFANPSCRDFILSYIDANPEYLAVLLGYGLELSNICMMLDYAAAQSTEFPARKFTGLGNYVRQNHQILRKSIKSRLDVRASGVEGNYLHLVQRAVAGLIEVDRELGLGWRDWLTEEIHAIARSNSAIHSTNFTATSTIIRMLHENSTKSDPLALESSVYRFWADAWTEAAFSDEHWLEIHSFCIRYADSYFVTECELPNLLSIAAIRSFDGELDDILEGSDDDIYGKQNRVRDIRHLADSLEISAHLMESFDRIEERIDDIEHYVPDPVDLDDRPAEAETAFEREEYSPSDVDNQDDRRAHHDEEELKNRVVEIFTDLR